MKSQNKLIIISLIYSAKKAAEEGNHQEAANKMTEVLKDFLSGYTVYSIPKSEISKDINEAMSDENFSNLATAKGSIMNMKEFQNVVSYLKVEDSYYRFV